MGSLTFASPLGAAAWMALIGVPVGIIALYFLKLRRRPVQVPSTMLWRRSLEDLHVNSLFQKLRRNLLLFLQLLMVGLLMLALLGLTSAGTTTEGGRVVLVIDQSASMAATDGTGVSRLDQAKGKAKEVIETLGNSDLAMVIAFSDKAKVASNYTSDQRELKKRIDAIELTESATSLREALQVAAGLANPSKMIDVKEGEVASEIMPPKMLIFTDGGFADVQGFSLGNLKPEIVLIGPKPPKDAKPDQSPSNNLGILALQTRRSDEKPDVFQIFGQVRNYRGEKAQATARLYVRDRGGKTALGDGPYDAIQLEVPPRGAESFQFEQQMPTQGAEIEVRLMVEDDLELDNRAYATIGNIRKAQVLAVTTPNSYLAKTLTTSAAQTIADVTVLKPDEAEADDVTRDMASGRYDLVIFDSHRPKSHPEANTIYFGAFPPNEKLNGSKTVEAPVILDWDLTHPLMQYIRDLRIVAIAKAQILELPPNAKPLVESDQGALAFTMPRDGYLDAVFTFPIMSNGSFNTNWPLKISFPLFLFNALQALGNASDNAANQTIRPGQPIALRAAPLIESMTVTAPGGGAHQLERTPQGSFVFNATDRVGLYRTEWRDGGSVFAVNLFDLRESDLSTRGVAPEGVATEHIDDYAIKIGFNSLDAAETVVPARSSLWKWFVAAALLVLVFEWYVYNRRVYL